MESTLTAISIFSGVVLAVIGFVLNQRNNRSNNTLEYISQFSLDENLVQSVFEFSLIEKKIKEDPNYDVRSNPKEWKVVMHLLNYYEFLVTYSIENEFDNRLIMYHRGKAMLRLYRAARKTIMDERRVIDMPHLWRNFEKFALRYKAYEDKNGIIDSKRLKA